MICTDTTEYTYKLKDDLDINDDTVQYYLFEYENIFENNPETEVRHLLYSLKNYLCYVRKVYDEFPISLGYSYSDTMSYNYEIDITRFVYDSCRFIQYDFERDTISFIPIIKETSNFHNGKDSKYWINLLSKTERSDWVFDRNVLTVPSMVFESYFERVDESEFAKFFKERK